MTDHSALIERPCAATDQADLRDRIMNPNVAKSEAEWWASREIERLESTLRDLTEWRDISTAPSVSCMGVAAFFGPAHDDLADCGNGRDERYEMTWFNGREWVEAGTAHSFIERDAEYRPTHWLPLPSAPNQAKEAGE